jgi:hypothetical protein
MQFDAGNWVYLLAGVHDILDFRTCGGPKQGEFLRRTLSLPVPSRTGKKGARKGKEVSATWEKEPQEGLLSFLGTIFETPESIERTGRSSG